MLTQKSKSWKLTKKDKQKQNEFNQKIDELNQETDYLIDEIDKWQT